MFQVWKTNVLPLIQQHIAEQLDSMTTFMLLQHEAAVANLLEVCCTTVTLQRVNVWVYKDSHCQVGQDPPAINLAAVECTPYIIITRHKPLQQSSNPYNCQTYVPISHAAIKQFVRKQISLLGYVLDILLDSAYQLLHLLYAGVA